MRYASWTLLVLLAAATVYGIAHERLYLQTWDPVGASRFLTYLAVVAGASGAIVWFCPRWFATIAAVFVLIYTIWWSGPAAPLAVLYFLGSCLLLGWRISRSADIPTAVLLGAAVWMFLFWISLHFPINTPLVYGAALLIPYVALGRSVLTLPRFRFEMQRKESAALAVLLAILLAHWLVALKPEISSDGLSMHLALPMSVAHNARWAFDFQNQIWALMPAGAESLYTAVFLLGGETATRLLNLSFLAIIAALVALGARRWVSPAWAWLAAALFVSTPLVEYVTGSLFVENVWAAMVVAATLALMRYLDTHENADLTVTGMLLGAALAVKLIAAAFVIPIALWAGVAVIRNRQWKAAVPAVALLGLLGTPPYLYAYAKSGNPVFPFANTIFKSPYWYSDVAFSDGHYQSKLSWDTPYELTFQSTKFIEGLGGSAGFQYFLLLLPLAVLIRRREQAVPLTLGAAAVGIIMLGAPNLRYMYGALPLFSIAIAWFLAQVPQAGAVAGLLFLIGLNLWFTPAAGPYNHDFALFRHTQIPEFLEQSAPARALVDSLNRTAPGEPVAFFSTDAIAGLNALSYADTWHNEHYWDRVRHAPTTSRIKAVFDQLGIRHVIAPKARLSNFLMVRRFLQLWLDPEGPSAGGMAVFRVREAELAMPHQSDPLGPGAYDDLEQRIEYTGPWFQDLQFPHASGQSLTYCDLPGASFRIAFNGTAIDYVYTTALNRGVAQVLIDGHEQARINQYSPDPVWQVKRGFGGLAPGVHLFEVRVTGERDPKSSGAAVDLDAFAVGP